MHVQLAQLLSSLATANGVIGARPALAGDGVDITSWTQGGYMPRVALVRLDGDHVGGTTIAAPAGGTGVEFWGYLLGEWRFAGNLYGSAVVPIAGPTQGFVEQVEDLAPFTRLAIAGAMGAGGGTYSFVPMETTR